MCRGGGGSVYGDEGEEVCVGDEGVNGKTRRERKEKGQREGTKRTEKKNNKRERSKYIPSTGLVTEFEI